jgi:hypothetical protein
MRTFALITAAMLFASATAHAGPTRSLTLASVDQPPVSESANKTTTAETGKADAAKSAEAPTAPVTGEAPQFVERPAAVAAPAPTTNTETPKADNGRPARNAKAERPHHKKVWTEARIISELHRHGIYW